VVDWISVWKRITSHPRKTRAQRRVRFPPSLALNNMKTLICSARHHFRLFSLLSYTFCTRYVHINREGIFARSRFNSNCLRRKNTIFKKLRCTRYFDLHLRCGSVLLIHCLARRVSEGRVAILRIVGLACTNPLPLTLSGRKPLISGRNHIKPHKNHLAKVATYCAQATNHINRLFTEKTMCYQIKPFPQKRCSVEVRSQGETR
jgi:hypothetical protein